MDAGSKLERVLRHQKHVEPALEHAVKLRDEVAWQKCTGRS